MTFNRIAFFLILLLSQQFITIPALAQGTMYPESEMGTGNGGGRKEAADFLKEVQKEVRTSIKSVTGSAIRGVVKPHQYPAQLTLNTSSGSAQFDADCIEALLDKQRQDNSPLILAGFWVFPLKLTTACSDKSAVGKVLVHKIPRSVLTKYPGVFEPSEIASRKNYIELHGTVSDKLSASQITEISNHYQQWHSFLETHPSATKEEILSAMESSNG